ncbi:response regulator [Paraburkholderia sp. MMS20-SJTR3]|uniref:Response regulator n=1 Tax=Paraburkholderia sejongensis TaxID=2886946 RepID=A0ABS8JS61_9BURK|nr:response regulator [Paraburkholderia sp. MMS20-SJTR3]MCC8392744.1 response regulator [Paraburkholderia sp. MMS20-SJTR3]
MKTILVVDDEFDILTVWRLLLERHGYTVLTASNGAVALELVRTSRPDIIVSDCMMPVMSGTELCAALNADADLREIPIILCSAAADLPAQPNPHIAYARKPLSFDQLLSMLVRMGP